MQARQHSTQTRFSQAVRVPTSRCDNSALCDNITQHISFPCWLMLAIRKRWTMRTFWVIFPNRKPSTAGYLIGHRAKIAFCLKRDILTFRKYSDTAFFTYLSHPGSIPIFQNESPSYNTNSGYYHWVHCFDNLRNIKIKYTKKVKDILVLPTSVDPVCTHSPNIILPTFSGFEKISRSQEPPSIGDMDLGS